MEKQVLLCNLAEADLLLLVCVVCNLCCFVMAL